MNIYESIKKMTVEEMAEFFVELLDCNNCRVYGDINICKNCKLKHKEDYLDWLHTKHQD